MFYIFKALYTIINKQKKDPMKVKVLLITLLSAGLLHAQSIEVIKKEKLPLTETAHNPVLNDKGDKVLFTTEDYKGLKLYDLSTKKQTVVSDENGAGYKPVFTADGEEVYFKRTTYKNGFKHDALLKTNLKKNRQEVVVEDSRSLKAPVTLKNGVAVVSEGKLLRTAKVEQPYVAIEDNKIALYQGSKRTELQPCGANVIGYVWPSVSPNGTKILFTCAGKGTFVSNLDGKIVAELGKLNAPVWYTDDFVVGMIDEDNGDVFTASKIVISSAKGNFKQDITDGSEIAMYPSASANSYRVAYSTLNGEIFILTLNSKK